MEIKISTIENVQVATLDGDIDASVAPEVSAQILPLATDSAKIILDMTKVPYMSSAGLRTLLSMYRKASTNQTQLVLVGLSEDIRDTMSVTGFLNFFEISDSVESAIAKLK
jgi:anti-sigma B factor antagonist